MRCLKTPARRVGALQFSADGAVLYCFGLEVWISPDAIEHLPARALRIDAGSGEIRGDTPLVPSDAAVFTPDFEAVYYVPALVPYAQESCSGLHRLDLRSGGSTRICALDDLSPLVSAALSPDGRMLAIAAGMLVVCLDPVTGTERDPIELRAHGVAWSPDGAHLAAWGPDGVRVWSGEVLSFQAAGPARLLAWAPDGRLAWGEREAILWRCLSSGEGGRCELAGTVTALAFSARGLLVGLGDGRCLQVDPATGRVLAELDTGLGCVQAVACTADGQQAATGEDGRVMVWG